MQTWSCNSLSCGYVSETKIDSCPTCGRPVRSSGRIRQLGVVQLIIGVFLAGFIAAIALALAPQLLSAGQSVGNGARFTGTRQEAMLIFGLFGILITFGIGSALNGLWQIATGRRNRWLIIAVVGFGLILIVGANVINMALTD